MSSRSPAAASHLPILEEPDQLKLRAWVQLARTYQLVCREIALLLAENDITMPQFDLLATLRFSEGATQQELATRLLVTKGNVCQVLDRLEEFGWVRRQADPKDARTNRLYLTAAGRKKIGAVLPRHDTLVLRAMKSLSAAEVQALRSSLQTLEQGVTAKGVMTR
jgi:DNA-binding MarR family transcriptional regulator